MSINSNDIVNIQSPRTFNTENKPKQNILY